MNVSKINSLVELYFNKADKIDEEKPFLQWLNPESNSVLRWKEVTEKILKLSFKIKNYINNGDRVLLLSENRPEWLITDLAIMNAGGITVPIFTTYAEKDYEYILRDCSPSLIIVSNNLQFKKIEKFINSVKVISFENIKKEILTFQNIFNENYEKNINYSLNRKTPACIIYTSGTSGNPKGVILSHGGILSNCEGALELLQPILKKKILFFLHGYHYLIHTNIQFK